MARPGGSGIGCLLGAPAYTMSLIVANTNANRSDWCRYVPLCDYRSVAKVAPTNGSKWGERGGARRGQELPVLRR